ncbi:GPR1/FUN34/yaaH family-domain-containing protein [Xylogone sp. PMI_703]|nr:GPR1/FUN34/yaaH family-domain-containing protein [Xylogone sp. PMI_703]
MGNIYEISSSKTAEKDIEAQLHEISPTGTVTISSELFEKLCLAPKVAEIGRPKKRFANATPLGLMGFVISSTTFSGVTLGWGGNTQLTGVMGIFYFTGPVLLILGTIFEWVAGEILSMLILGLFSVFWLSFGTLQTPTLQIAQAYSPTGDAAEGAASTGFNAAVALYLMVWGFWLFTVFIFTLRKNVVLAATILLASTGSFLLGGAYWKLSVSDFSHAAHLQKAGGSVFFVVSMLGWYRTFVIVTAELGMFSLPLGDLSHFWPDKAIGKKE